METTALGAAFLAGLSAGLWSEIGQIADLREPGTLFEPTGSAAQAEALCAAWRRAVERAADWARD